MNVILSACKTWPIAYVLGPSLTKCVKKASQIDLRIQRYIPRFLRESAERAKKKIYSLPGGKRFVRVVFPDNFLYHFETTILFF